VYEWDEVYILKKSAGSKGQYWLNLYFINMFWWRSHALHFRRLQELTCMVRHSLWKRSSLIETSDVGLCRTWK
jgi:hypothetical protein